MSLAALAQIAQIISTVVAAVAAVFAAKSSRASSRAAEVAQESQRLLLEARARELVPEIGLYFDPEPDEDQTTFKVEVLNEDDINEARDLRIEVRFAGGKLSAEPFAELIERYRWISISEQSILAAGHKTYALVRFIQRAQSELPEGDKVFQAPAYIIRGSFTDEQGIARWSTSLSIVEQAQRVRDQISYEYHARPQSKTVRFHEPVEEVTTNRAVAAWRVLRGLARAVNE